MTVQVNGKNIHVFAEGQGDNPDYFWPVMEPAILCWISNPLWMRLAE